MIFGVALAAHAQTSTFTYQGHVTENGTPPTGTLDLEFRLFSAAAGGLQIGSLQTLSDVGVTSGCSESFCN